MAYIQTPEQITIEYLNTALRQGGIHRNALRAERDALREEITRLKQQLADACAEIDRLREYCDTHGMPGLETDEE